MNSESFWGCKLSKDNKEYKLTDLADDSAKIIVKKVILDKFSDHQSVVEVTTELYNEDSFKFNIGRFDKERPEQVWDIMFPAEKTSFKLIDGDGPVTLIGSVVVGYDAPYELGSSDESEDVEDEDVEEDKEMVESIDDLRKKLNEKALRKPGQKTKLDLVAVKKNTKKAKLDETNADSDEDDDDDDEDDDSEEEMEEEPPKKTKQNVQAKKKVPANVTQTKKPIKQELKNGKSSK